MRSLKFGRRCLEYIRRKRYLAARCSLPDVVLKLAIWLPLATLPLLLCQVRADEWAVTPNLTVREIYTDNITLAPNNEDSELVTEVRSGVVVTGQGGRISMNLGYNLQAILFPSGDFDNEVNHQLDATGTGELIEELFFLDVDGAVFQTNANNTNRQAADNISQTGNTIDTYLYRVSPFLRKRLGSFAQSELRYAFGEVMNEGDTVDSEYHRVRFQMDSGSRFSRLPWQLFGETRDVDFDDGTETEFRQAGGSLRYIFGRRISIFGRGGYEAQDFGTSREDEEGIFWQAGATWTPSPRTKFEGGYGERFFGKNFFFTLEHNSRRTMLRASFSEDVSLFGDEILASRVESGTRIRVPTNQATPTSEVLVAQRFDGSISFTGRRADLKLSGFHEDRDFQDTGDEETVFGAFATIDHNISKRMTLRLVSRWEDTRFRDGIRKDTRWETDIAVSRRFGTDAEGSIGYRYTDLNSNQRANEFKENRITAEVTINF